MSEPLILKYGGEEITLAIPQDRKVEILKEPGPISEPVTREMVEKALDDPIA